MTKWEYNTKPISFAAFGNPGQSVSEQLDMLGNAEWELVQIVNAGGSNFLAIFKRPAPVEPDLVDAADSLPLPTAQERVDSALQKLRTAAGRRVGGVCPTDGNILSEDGVCGFCGNDPTPVRVRSLTERALIKAREMLASDKASSLEQLRIAKLIIHQRDCYIRLGKFNYDRGHPSKPEWFGSWAQDLFATVDVEI